MRKLFVLILLTLSIGILFAQFSAGIILGEPSGVSAKYQFSKNLAIDVGAAYSFLWGISGIHLSADVVYLEQTLFRISDQVIPIYAGAGFRYFGLSFFGFTEGYTVGVRIPLGILYPFQLNDTVRLEVFGEVVPTFELIPDVSFKVSFGLGIRYVF